MGILDRNQVRASEYSLGVGGYLSGETLPLTDLGAEVITKDQRLEEIRATRGTAGSSGTTTAVLEVNGTPTAHSVSWVGGVDGNGAVKLADISLDVVAGDILSFRVTSVEAGNPADIILRVS